MIKRRRQWYLVFSLLGLERVGMTCNDGRVIVQYSWGIRGPISLRAGPEKNPGGGPGATRLEAPKNSHLTVSKTGSKTDQKHVDGYAFFMCIAVQSHRKIPKGPKF